MDPSDKYIQETSYDEEYDDMQNLLAWTPISESEYKKMRPITRNFLSTMTISNIKYDENGATKQAKQRIVILGNLDLNDW